MTSRSSLVLVLTALAGCLADSQVSEYIYWKKADMSAWHQYFPSRQMQEERLTNSAAAVAVQGVSDGLEASLGKVVQYQAQELETAQFMMEGTSAQGCVRGIASYMGDAIQDEVSTYKDCSADASSKLKRLSSTLAKSNANLQTLLQRALAGIDSCAKTYPNRDSLSRLRVCVDSWFNNYFSGANNTRLNVLTSPSMAVFTSTVVSCAESAAREVVAKGWKFLDMLVHCAKLSENMDWQNYQADVSSGFSSYLTDNDLINQTRQAQIINDQQVKQVEQEMRKYYDLQKRALEKYVIESRGQGYYSSLMYGYLQQYFSTVAQAASDNPGSAECTSSARAKLEQAVSIGSAAALQCDQTIVADAKYRINKVNNDFMGVNSVMPSIGNVAILGCFNRSFFFADKTIYNGFKLVSNGFTVNSTEVKKDIDNNVSVLTGYENSFFNNASLPCGDVVIPRAIILAEQAVYELQRCLYIGYGTKYSVTTPQTDVITTTTTAAPS